MIGADTTFLVELEVQEHPSHISARALLQREVLDARMPLALAPQVLAEFIHIVTDPRRFRVNVRAVHFQDPQTWNPGAHPPSRVRSRPRPRRLKSFIE